MVMVIFVLILEEVFKLTQVLNVRTRRFRERAQLVHRAAGKSVRWARAMDTVP